MCINVCVCACVFAIMLTVLISISKLKCNIDDHLYLLCHVCNLLLFNILSDLYIYSLKSIFIYSFLFSYLIIHFFSLLFLGDLLKQKVITLSEGQKGLLSMCSLILQKPSILILDEPTNHINFRHLKSLANAIKKFEGAVLLVSHDEEFVRNVDITDTIDLGFQIK